MNGRWKPAGKILRENVYMMADGEEIGPLKKLEVEGHQCDCKYCDQRKCTLEVFYELGINGEEYEWETYSEIPESVRVWNLEGNPLTEAAENTMHFVFEEVESLAEALA